MKTIFHLDMDAFFVSVERILDPSLKGKPVIVGGDPQGRGVVTACSYESRKFGLHSGMPIRQAYKLCPQGIYLHGHYKEYVRFSNGVRNILERYAPILQQASVDEYYMDFTGTEKIYGSFPEFAKRLQREIEAQTGLPSSIGIGKNKNIAKIGSDFNKPMGITYVAPGTEKDFLAPLPIEAMPGIGKKTSIEFHTRGFHKIGDIAAAPQEYFSAAFGKYGTDLWYKSNGEGNDILTLERDQKSISKEHTFDEDATNKDKIYNILFNLTGQVCQNLRDLNWMALTVSIKLRYSDFQTLTRSKTIEPTCDDKVVYESALKLIEKANTRRIAIRLIGVGVSKFIPYSQQQLLFDDEETRRKRMLEAVNTIRSKFGYDFIKIGI